MTDAFNAIAQKASQWAGSAWFFALNVGAILIYIIIGITAGFSDTLNIVTTTTLTVATQLLVLLLQATANRDGRALHLKLDEVLRALSSARTELARAEDMSADEIEEKIEEIKEEMG